MPISMTYPASASAIFGKEKFGKKVFFNAQEDMA